MNSTIHRLIRFLAAISERAATGLLYFLGSFPRSLPVRPQWQAELDHAKRIEFQRDGTRVAWQWGESGPLVVCVHGWEGTGAQFGMIGRTLAQQGCRCVSIDLTAHGASSGRRAQFSDFPQDIMALVDHLNEPVAAYVCHSAGGMLLMAARRAAPIAAPRYVVIASPSAPYPPVEIVREAISARDDTVQRLRNRIAAQFSSDWDSLISGHLYSHNPEGDLLLLYDENDRAIEHTQGDVIHRLWPGSRLIKTKGLGHNRILWDPDVVQEICQFVGMPAAAMMASPETANNVVPAADEPVSEQRP